MTIAEQIINNCRKGLFTVVKDNNNEYCVFSPIRDKDGDFRGSHWYKDINKAKNNIAETCLFSRDIKNLSKEHNWQIVEVYRLPVEPFKVGDKVRILDTIKDTYNGDLIKDDYPDMTGEVISVFDEVDGLRYKVKSKGTWVINHQFLAPYYEDDDDLIDIDGKKFSKSTIKEALKNYIN